MNLPRRVQRIGQVCAQRSVGCAELSPGRVASAELSPGSGTTAPSILVMFFSDAESIAKVDASLFVESSETPPQPERTVTVRAHRSHSRVQGTPRLAIVRIMGHAARERQSPTTCVGTTTFSPLERCCDRAERSSEGLSRACLLYGRAGASRSPTIILGVVRESRPERAAGCHAAVRP